MPGLVQPERQVALNDAGTHIIAVKVRSFFSGKWNTWDFQAFPIACEDWNRWQRGHYIQSALPNLSPDAREFLLTGATPAEWDAAFKDPD